MNNVIKGNSFAKVYKQVLELVCNNPDFICAPRGQKIKECLNVTLVLEDPLNNLFHNEVRKFPVKYLANETLLYLSGTNLAEDFGKHAKLWLDIQNDDGTINSAYGHLIFKKQNCKWNEESCAQFDWVINSLVKDPDSRQAIMHYNTPDHQYSGVKDFVCTLHNQFFIRNGKLYMNYYFRSQDVVRGMTFDVPWATTVMQLVLLKLQKEKYPELELGTLSYTCASLHIYEQHFTKMEAALQQPFFEARMPKITKEIFTDEPCEFLEWLRSHK